VHLVTASGTSSITTAGGNEAITIDNAVGATTISAGDGNNTINISAASAAANITSGNGTDAITLPSAAGPTTIVAGNGDKTIHLTNASNATSITTGTGTDSVLIDHANGPTTIAAGDGNDTLHIVSALSTTQLSSGAGSDVILLDNAAGAANISAGDGANIVHVANATASVSVTSGGGNSAIAIDNAGGAVNVNTGNGNNTVAVGIARTTSSITTGSGNDAITLGNAIGATTINAGDGANTVHVSVAYSTSNLSSGGGNDSITLNNAVGATTVSAGDGNNAVQVGSAYSSASVTTGSGADAIVVGSASGAVGINAGGGANIVHLGNASSSLTYSGGSGNDSLTVDHAGGAVTINAGDGNNTVNIPAVPGQASITTGSGNDLINIPIFHGVTAINSGNGNDTIYLRQSDAATTIITGSGIDTITAGSLSPATTGGTLDNFPSGMTVQSGGNTTLTLDDSASTAAKTITLGGAAITGLTPGPINYSGLSNLNLNLGHGATHLNVTGASATTAVSMGAGGDDVSIAPTAGVAGLPSTLLGSLSLIPSPSTSSGQAGAGNTLLIDDTSNTRSTPVNLTPTDITGLGGDIHYVNFASLTVHLAGSDMLTGNGINPATNTTVTGGSVNLNLTGSFTGALALGNLTGGSVAIAHDLVGTVTVAGTLDHFSVGGALAGSLSLGGSLGMLSIAGHLTGSLSTGGNLTNATIGGSLAATGSISVGGTIGNLAISGADSGHITANSVNNLSVAAATVDAAGHLFTLTTAGIDRSITASHADGSAAVDGMFALDYNGTFNPNPQVALRILHTSSSPYDLTLNAPSSDWLDLSRLDASTHAALNLRNILVEGSLLGGVTPAAGGFFSLSGGLNGGIQLPAANLGIVAVRDQLPANSILAAGIQGLAFSGLTDSTNSLHTANSLIFAPNGKQLLLSALAVNPLTHKPYAKLLSPNQNLEAVVSTKATVGLFTTNGPNGKKYFDPRGLLLSDQASDGSTLSASATFAAGVHPHPIVTQLSFFGDGGSVNSGLLVQNITSNGPLGDIQLYAGKTEILQSLTAPSIFGNINLFGGTLIGTLQTTGVAGQHAVGADLGSINNGIATELDLKLAPGAMIVSRGELLSHVQIAGALDGTIASAGDIGQGVGATRAGGITVMGHASSTGRIISLANIVGDVSIAGKFAGRLAAKGVGDAQGNSGILGNVTLISGLTPTAAILSGGQIGDPATGAILTLLQNNKGLIVAAGAINTHPTTSPTVGATPGPQFDNAGNALDALWNNNGTPLGIDSQKGTGDLQGLAELTKNVNSARIAAGGTVMT